MIRSRISMSVVTLVVASCLLGSESVLAEGDGKGFTFILEVAGAGIGAAEATADKNDQVADQEVGIYLYQRLGFCTVTRTVIKDGPAEQFFDTPLWIHDFKARYEITFPWALVEEPGDTGRDGEPTDGGDADNGTGEPRNGSGDPDDGTGEPRVGRFS